MPARGRYFVALLPPADAAGAMHAIGQSLAADYGGRVVPIENLHMTLVFVGAVPIEDEQRLARCVYAASEALPPQRALALERCGAWRAGAAWLAPERTPRWAAALARRVGAALEADGFEFDAKPFRAHVTVVRGGGRVPLAPIDPIPATPWRLALVRSFTEPAGSRYLEVPRPTS